MFFHAAPPATERSTKEATDQATERSTERPFDGLVGIAKRIYGVDAGIRFTFSQRGCHRITVFERQVKMTPGHIPDDTKTQLRI